MSRFALYTCLGGVPLGLWCCLGSCYLLPLAAAFLPGFVAFLANCVAMAAVFSCAVACCVVPSVLCLKLCNSDKMEEWKEEGRLGARLVFGVPCLVLLLPVSFVMAALYEGEEWVVVLEAIMAQCRATWNLFTSFQVQFDLDLNINLDLTWILSQLSKLPLYIPWDADVLVEIAVNLSIFCAVVDAINLVVIVPILVTLQYIVHQLSCQCCM